MTDDSDKSKTIVFSTPIAPRPSWVEQTFTNTVPDGQEIPILYSPGAEEALRRQMGVPFNPHAPEVVASIIEQPKISAGGLVRGRPVSLNLNNESVIPTRKAVELGLVKPGLLTASAGYKPFRYPWAHEFWLKQQQVHWMPEEVPLGEDIKDWAAKLNDKERNLLTQIFRWFTQADIEVQDNYMERYGRVFKPTEVKMMLASFANMETIHIAAYALLLETIGMPESEFSAFTEIDVMRDKHDYMARFGVDTPEDVLRTLAMFGGFSEGLQLFASFAMLMNFPRLGKMKGMGQIVSWSIRDESLHCDGIIRLFHAFSRETGALTPAVVADIVDCCRHVVEMEDRFVDLAFEAGEVEGMTPEDIKTYVRFIADWRLRQLGLPEIYGVKENPLPWLQAMLSGVEHANFFEARATEYSKAASRGTWPGVWAGFDQLRARQSQF